MVDITILKECKICGHYSVIYKFIPNNIVRKCPMCEFVFYEFPFHETNKKVKRQTRNNHYKNYKKEKYFKTILSSYIKPNMKFLDIGCATGLSTKVVNDLGGIGYGIDTDKHLIQWGRKEFNTNRLFCADITQKNIFKKNYFDIIFLNHSIEHIYDLETLMKNLKLCLAENGKIIVLCPNYGRKYKKEKIGDDHVNYFKNQNIIYLFFKNGFKVVKNPFIKNWKFNIYYYINHLLKNRLNLFQIWLTFER